MGNLYRGECSCGYESGMVSEGIGMAGPQTSRSLVGCERCHELFSIASSRRPRCPKCRGQVTVCKIDHWKVPAGGPLAIQCPRCGQPTMMLVQAGFWD